MLCLLDVKRNGKYLNPYIKYWVFMPIGLHAEKNFQIPPIFSFRKDS
jgi:hypothetical protein